MEKSIIELTQLLREYKILSAYLINKIEKDKYIDKEELKDLLISLGFDIKEKEKEENER